MADFARPESATDELGDFGDLLEMITAGHPAWHRDALCKEPAPGATWFPESGQVAEAAAAKAICSRCLVREECLAWSLEQDASLDGIFGGLNKRGRSKLRAPGRPGRKAAA